MNAVQAPRMIGIGYHLVAMAKDGTALYEMRNWRMGGRSFRIRRPDGTETSWNAYNVGTMRPKPAPVGRWKWEDR